MRTGSVRQLLLVAVGTFGKPWAFQTVMRAAIPPACG